MNEPAYEYVAWKYTSGIDLYNIVLTHTYVHLFPIDIFNYAHHPKPSTEFHHNARCQFLFKLLHRQQGNVECNNRSLQHLIITFAHIPITLLVVYTGSCLLFTQKAIHCLIYMEKEVNIASMLWKMDVWWWLSAWTTHLRNFAGFLAHYTGRIDFCIHH